MPSAALNAIFATALLLFFSEIVLAQPAAPSRAEDERMLKHRMEFFNRIGRLLSHADIMMAHRLVSTLFGHSPVSASRY